MFSFISAEIKITLSIMLGQKNVLYVSQAPPRHLQHPTSKIFIAFRLYITNFQFKFSVICGHFVCFWLVG